MHAAVSLGLQVSQRVLEGQAVLEGGQVTKVGTQVAGRGLAATPGQPDRAFQELQARSFGEAKASLGGNRETAVEGLGSP